MLRLRHTESLLSFELPERLIVKEPPEASGLRRDQIRLFVYDRRRQEIKHTRFDRLPDFLHSGDVLVLNDSRTIPAHLTGTTPLGKVEVNLFHGEGNLWHGIVTPQIEEVSEIDFGRGLKGEVIGHGRKSEVWTFRLRDKEAIVLEALYQHGRPVQYEHLTRDWDLDYFQTVYATHPGSAEMPSAGRGFSWELLFRLKDLGLKIVFVTLHSSLSYLRANVGANGPLPEEYSISAEAAHTVIEGNLRGARIIAVGTTVVRALESAAKQTGKVESGRGLTNLHIRRGFEFRVANGLLTGFHEPRSSHLELVSDFAGGDNLRRIYAEALREGYLWHEFGDANLIL